MTAELAAALADHGVYLLSKQRREEVSAALHLQGVTAQDVAELDAWIRSREDSDTAAVLAVAFHLTIWLGCLVVTVLHWCGVI